MFTIEALDLSSRTDAKRIHEIQRLAYGVEAKLIGFDGIPPLHESLDDLIRQPLQWLGIRECGRIIAAIAYDLDDDLCDIDRLVVDPEHFGRGCGSDLVSALLDYPHVLVSTGTANFPARRLYEKLGFHAIGDVELDEGVRITRYERRSDG